MTARPPNILLLTVDALRADRTSLYGYDRPTTPCLERLAGESLLCETALSLGPFTQSACVQLFTSTAPLSYGGFDAGATGRPATVFKHFQSAGYRTIALSTLHWVNRYFGYGDGLTDEHQLFIPNALVGVAVANMRNSLAGYHDGTFGREEMLATVPPVIAKLFSDADTYCELRLENQAQHEKDYPDSLFVNERYDFRKVKRLIARHRADFENNPAAYIDAQLASIPRSHEWLAADWRFCRPLSRLAHEAVFRVANRITGLFSPLRAGARAARFRQYVDASALADKTISFLREADHDKPFLLWTHFMDTHIPYVSGRGRHWYRETPRYLETLGYDGTIDPALNFREERPADESTQKKLSALYDAAVLWTDEQIGRIIGALDEAGLGDNTVVAICGDHGEELGDHGDIGHYFLFYEHNVRIPMIFRRRNSDGARIQALNTTMDLAPTLADMAGLDPADGWQGAPVGSGQARARKHVVMETFYGGNCLFEHRPIYLAVRTATHKYMWKEYRDPRDTFSPDGHQLYDLGADPQERNNIYRDDHPAVGALNAVLAGRLAALPEIAPGRIIAAFGKVGETALREAGRGASR